MDAVTLLNHHVLYLRICKELEARGYDGNTISAEFYQMVHSFGDKPDMRSKIIIRRKRKEEKDEVLEFYMRDHHGTCVQVFVDETIHEEVNNQKLFNLFHEIIKDNVCTCDNKTRYSVEDGKVIHILELDITI